MIWRGCRPVLSHFTQVIIIIHGAIRQDTKLILITPGNHHYTWRTRTRTAELPTTANIAIAAKVDVSGQNEPLSPQDPKNVFPYKRFSAPHTFFGPQTTSPRKPRTFSVFPHLQASSLRLQRRRRRSQDPRTFFAPSSQYRRRRRRP